MHNKLITILTILFTLLSSLDLDNKFIHTTNESSITAATPAPEKTVQLQQADQLSIERLLLLAKEPLGNTMYVWGGGWNEEDTGVGIEARTLGISPTWAEFAAKQSSEYNYKDTRYQIHNGLDCSGYIGWLIYNLIETEDGREGYVMKSSDMAYSLSERGFGSFTPAEEVTDWQAGDIMSMDGHVWMVIGLCADGSVVLIHSSPPGVILSGTKLPDGQESDATYLADYYMKTYYPEWYTRYPNTSKPYTYLSKSDRMRWYEDVLSDNEGLRNSTADEVLAWLFNETNGGFENVNNR